MKNIIAIIILLLPFLSNGQTYQTDFSQSHINWTGKAAFNAYSLSGKIIPKSGAINLVDEQITSASLVIDMSTLSSEIKDLTKHLKSNDFFDVKKYPTASFQSREVRQVSNDSVALRGILTIKDISKPYEIVLEVNSTADGGYFCKGRTAINRTDFGITYNSPNFFQNLKEQAIADEFILDFEVLFSQ